MGNNSGQALVLFNTALIHHLRGHYNEALKLYEESLVINRELGDKQGIVSSLVNVAGMYQIKGL